MKRLNKIFFLLITVFFILPVISSFIWAFFLTYEPNMKLPQNFSLNGFIYFFSSKDFFIASKSVLFSCFAAFVSLVLSIMLSRFFLTTDFKYKVQFETLFYLPMLLPVVSICIGSHKVFLHLFSHMGGFAVFVLHIYFSLPYAFKLVYSYYTVWGMEQEYVARGLGANKYEAFYLINLPQYIRGYAESFVMAFIISYSQYFINFFVGDSKYVNFSMIMTPYLTSSNRNILSVYTVMFVLYGIIVMIICSIAERVLTKNKFKGEI